MTAQPIRPSLARVHTRTTEANRSDALDSGIRISLGDEVYEVRVGDLNALHERALRKQYGVPFSGLVDEFEGAPGLDSIAAVVWLARYMRGETTLTYDAVAESVDLEFAEAMTLDQTDAEVADSPEA